MELSALIRLIDSAAAPETRALGANVDAAGFEKTEGMMVAGLGKGQMGSALMGSLQIPCVLTEGLFVHSR